MYISEWLESFVVRLRCIVLVDQLPNSALEESLEDLREIENSIGR